MTDMTGKVVLVTGGSTGIGFATAIRFVQAGAKVAIASSNATKGEAALFQLREISADAIYVQADISQAEQVENLIKTVIDTFGQLNFAVNNAGIELMSPTHETGEEDWDRVIDINLKGIWLSMKYEVPQMLQNGGGAIVNISSTAGDKAFAGMSAYVSSKHGVNGISQVAALEYSEHGVRVNVVSPGPIATPMMDRVKSYVPNVDEMFAESTALKRVGQPEEIANAVFWLCSDEASYVTGAIVPVDGGMLAN